MSLYKFICILLVSALLPIEALAEEEYAYINVGNGMEGTNISLVRSDVIGDGVTEAAVIDGVKCRSVSKANYMYFDVNNSYISGSDNNITVFVTYYDEGIDDLEVQYPANDDTSMNSNYKPVSVKRTNSKTWKTKQFDLRDARLANSQQSGKADFRIRGMNDQNYISEVKLIKNYDVDYEELFIKACDDGIFTPGNVTMSFSGYQNEEEEKKYSIKCTATFQADGSQTECKPSDVKIARANYDDVKEFRIPELKKYGVYDLEFVVSDGQKEVLRVTDTICVLSDYSETYTDKFGTFGTNVHLQQWINNMDVVYKHARLAKKIGFTTIRDNITWNQVEPSKGTFNDTLISKFYSAAINYDLNLFRLFGPNANIYLTDEEREIGGSYYAPKRYENIKAYGKQLSHMAGLFPSVYQFEIWNEPDHAGVWKPAPNPYELASLIKEASLAVREVNPDAEIIAHTIGEKWAPGFADTLFEQNLYPYIDTYSHHYYQHCIDPRGNYRDEIYENGNEIIDRAGGWKNVGVSEVGYTQVSNNLHIDDYDQADYILVSYVLLMATHQKFAIYYDLINDGTDPNNREHNFGIFTNDLKPKLSAVTSRQIAEKLNGGLYVGKTGYGNSAEGHLFIKNGKPCYVIWSKEAEEIDLGQRVISCDIFGNEQAADKLKIEDRAVFVTNPDRNNVLKAVKDETDTRIDAWASDFKGMENAKFEELKNYSYSLEQDSLSEFINLVFDCGEEIIKKGATDKNTMLSLSKLNEIAEPAMAALSMVYSGEKSSMESDKAISDVKKLQSEVTENDGIYVFADTIRKKAQEYNNIGNKIKSESDNSKNGLMAAYDIMACGLAKWSAYLTETEEPDMMYKVLVHSNPSDISMYSSVKTKLQITIANHKSSEIKGVAGIYDENGNLISKEEKISVGAKTNYTFETEINPPEFEENHDVMWSIVFTDEAGNEQRQALPVKLIKNISLSAGTEPISSSLENVKDVSFVLSTDVDCAVNANVTITPPNGWKMSENEKRVKIGKGDNIVSFGIDIKKKRAFNRYLFHVKVEDDYGNILLEDDCLLSFTAVVKAKNSQKLMSFDISGWSDAYPVFLTGTKNPANLAEWKEQNIAGAFYMKWDEQNLYVLADIYDNIHVNYNNLEDIWNGDSIQLAFDTKNTKTGSYDADDYELCYALNGIAQGYKYRIPAEQEPGEISADTIMIRRNDDENNTRYVIRIPKSQIAPLELKEGNIFGANVLVNDSDLTVRESWIELKEATAGSKNPSRFCNWVMLGEEFNPLKSVIGVSEYIMLN